MQSRLFAAILLTLTSAIVSASDWPGWRGPNRDSVWNDTGILEKFPPEGLQIQWRVPVGRGFSSPAVANGRVYVTDVQIAEPVATERLLCLNESNGKLIWSLDYDAGYPEWAFDPNGGGPRATPLIHDGKVYSLGAMGRLVCLDAQSGKMIWEKNLAKEYEVKEFSGITGSPLIEDGLLILQIFGKPAASVVAWDKDTGKEAWRALDDSFTYCSPAVVSAAGKKQLIAWSQEALTSLDVATGQTFWREFVKTSGDMSVATPIASGNLLYAAGLMFKLDAEKPAASVIWPETRVPGKRVLSNTSTALIQGECLYSAKTSGALVCLEMATGKQLWEDKTITDLMNGSSIHLTPCGDAVFLFTDRGELIRAQLSPQGYREISRARLIEPTYTFGTRKCAWAAPAFADRHVFVRSDAELVCASLAKKE